MEEVIRDDSSEYSPEIDEIVVPLAAFHPTIGTIDISVGMNDGQEGQVHQIGVGAGEKGGKEIGWMLLFMQIRISKLLLMGKRVCT